MLKFNINEHVKVKLTNYGRTVLAEEHALFWEKAGHPKPPEYTPPKEDREGWSKWQMWALMQAFGSHISLGGENCFETTIELMTQKSLNTRWVGGDEETTG